MKKIGRAPVRRLVAVCAVVAMLFAMAGVAYAADVGDIQKTIKIWLYGEEEVKTADGVTSYTVSVGKVSVGADASEDSDEPPIGEDEVAEYLDRGMPEVNYLDDGRVIVYFNDREIDVTDSFEDGQVVIPIEVEGHTCYLTIVYGEGYSMSW